MLLSSGYAYILPKHENVAHLRNLDKGGQQLIVLNSDLIKFEKKYLFGLVSLDVKDGSFLYSYSGQEESFEFNEIIPFWDTTQHPDNSYLGVSRLESLQREITNIVLADKGKTNQIKLSGHTIVTPRTRNRANDFDQGLDTPVDFNDPNKTEKTVIEERLHNGGLSQDKAITVSGVELDSFNLTHDIKDIDFGKFKRDDEKNIYNQFEIPPEFHQLDGKGATFENREKAGIEIIDHIVKPIAANLCESIRSYYEHPYKIEIDFSDSPYYSYTNKQKAEKQEKRVQTLIQLLNNNLITASEVTQILQNEGII